MHAEESREKEEETMNIEEENNGKGYIINQDEITENNLNDVNRSDKMQTNDFIGRGERSLINDRVELARERYKERVRVAEKEKEKKNGEKNQVNKEVDGNTEEKKGEQKSSHILSKEVEEMVSESIFTVNKNQLTNNVESSSREEREKVDHFKGNPTVILGSEYKDNNSPELALKLTNFDSAEIPDIVGGTKRKFTCCDSLEIEDPTGDGDISGDANVLPNSIVITTSNFEGNERIRVEMHDKNDENQNGMIKEDSAVNDALNKRTITEILLDIGGPKYFDNETEISGVIHNTELEKIGISKDNSDSVNANNGIESLNDVLNNGIVPDGNTDLSQHNIMVREISVTTDFEDFHTSKKPKNSSNPDELLDRNEISDSSDEVHAVIGGDMSALSELVSTEIEVNKKMSPISAVVNNENSSSNDLDTENAISKVADNDGCNDDKIDRTNDNDSDDVNNASNQYDNSSNSAIDNNDNRDENMQKNNNNRKKSTIPQKGKRKFDFYYEKEYEKELLKDTKERLIITEKMIHSSLSTKGNLKDQLFVSIRPSSSPSFSCSSPASTSSSTSSSSSSLTISKDDGEYVPASGKFRFRLQRYPEEDRLPCLENSFFESYSSDKSVTVGGLKKILQIEFSKFNPVKSSSSTSKINPILYGPLNLELILSVVLKNENKKNSSPVYYLNKNFTTLWSVYRLIAESNVKCIIEYRSIVPK